MKKARYICLEGTEGVGKTTQTQKLVDFLRSSGYSVLQTKEPGTPLNKLTMTLRGIMLDNQYDADMTKAARELISQAIRSIHMERVILPALYEYDFIIQDRGILSGLSYGSACGNSQGWLYDLIDHVMPVDDYTGQPIEYDNLVYLKGDVNKGLQKALASKKEFAAGDAMESRGNDFLKDVSHCMDLCSRQFKTDIIYVDDKSIESVHSEILKYLKIKEIHGQQES